MKRAINLLNYLPDFMKEYKEMKHIADAETPEFSHLADISETVLNNQFIASCNETGIARFEKILKITPTAEDTIESRRSRVQSRWYNTIPYTMRAFILKLISLCGEGNFEVIPDYNNYHIEILTDLELFGQVSELEHIIDTMFPCNIVFNSVNTIPCTAEGNSYTAGGVCAVEEFLITNDFKLESTISGTAAALGGTVSSENMFITNDFNESYSVQSEAALRGGAINTASVVITNDFNEQFNISAESSINSAAVMTETIEINSN